MARYKNALRQHYIAEVDGTDNRPGRIGSGWLIDRYHDDTKRTESVAYRRRRYT